MLIPFFVSFVFASVVNPDSLNPDPGPAFQVNPDPVLDPVPVPDPGFL